MRVLDLAWSIQLNQRERQRHAKAFPLKDEQPRITITKLPTNRYVVESQIGARPVRLNKVGGWEAIEVSDEPLQRHQFSTWDAAMNSLSRGERGTDDDERGDEQAPATEHEAEQEAAAA